MRLPVVTESGTVLGHVVDAEIDDARLEIIRIAVQPKGVTGFFASPLLIHRSQIVRITEENIIVHDAAVKDAGKRPATASS